jgi:hypothetical protein
MSKPSGPLIESRVTGDVGAAYEGWAKQCFTACSNAKVSKSVQAQLEKRRENYRSTLEPAIRFEPTTALSTSLSTDDIFWAYLGTLGIGFTRRFYL